MADRGRDFAEVAAEAAATVRESLSDQDLSIPDSGPATAEGSVREAEARVAAAREEMARAVEAVYLEAVEALNPCFTTADTLWHESEARKRLEGRR